MQFTLTIAKSAGIKPWDKLRLHMCVIRLLTISNNKIVITDLKRYNWNQVYWGPQKHWLKSSDVFCSTIILLIGVRLILGSFILTVLEYHYNPKVAIQVHTFFFQNLENQIFLVWNLLSICVISWKFHYFHCV